MWQNHWLAVSLFTVSLSRSVDLARRIYKSYTFFKMIKMGWLQCYMDWLRFYIGWLLWLLQVAKTWHSRQEEIFLETTAVLGCYSLQIDYHDRQVVCNSWSGSFIFWLFLLLFTKLVCDKLEQAATQYRSLLDMLFATDSFSTTNCIQFSRAGCCLLRLWDIW